MLTAEAKRFNQPFGYTEWLIRLKHLFIGVGMMNRQNKHYTNVPDRKAFRPFYEDGLSPFQVLNIEIEEGWE